MEIRYISEADDRKEISKIYEESWKYAYRGIIPQAYLDAVSAENWVKNFDIPGWQTMVCIENGKYIGTSSFCKSRFDRYPDSGEVISIYFKPDFIGKGYGHRLIEAVLDEMRKQGYSEVFLWVLEENVRARQFYESCGFFKTDDYLNDQIGGKEVREVRYVYRPVQTHLTYQAVTEQLEALGNVRSAPMLESAAELLALLGNPQNRYRCIHVAGTNGKGTTSGMIAASLRAAGFSVGLYTSPSLEKLNERIAVNGADIDDAFFARVFEKVLDAAKKMTRTPTKFDLLTAGGLLAFAEAGCDYGVLEVGLGGRYDATNVIAPPAAAVITSISLDHTALLGPDIPTIAAEKAGIIKPGTEVCVCTSGQSPEALPVLRSAANAAGVAFRVPAEEACRVGTAGPDGTDFLYKGVSYHVSMPGYHFVQNALTAIEALQSLGTVPQDAICRGVGAVRTPARFETLCRAPRIIFDGAHNPDAAAKLAASVKSLYPGQKIITVMGMFADKDCAGAVPALAAITDVFYAVHAAGPRAVSAQTVAELAAPKAGKVLLCGEPEEGLAKAIDDADENTVVLCCGSFSLYHRMKDWLAQKGYLKKLDKQSEKE